nr:immunoglobulin light chain junction region [Macaca mulatta]MOX99588.1 immunoglobulin light chain junction region [Macaca mulatta]MOY00125.1 immunoglobulin light chain junction region [Macaca mulatta]MOY00512.1 immunoglobulin light chain junction region [Macaca mulatta]MOY00541.1 immunoglobulin light chain junction region [Macaca mulatta]
CQQFYDLLPTF